VRFNAPSFILLPRQLGHTARPLHENATAWCSWQVLQKRWASPRNLLKCAAQT
jgi:hypothetical protein